MDQFQEDFLSAYGLKDFQYLSQGGFGSVYSAVQDGVRVAVKLQKYHELTAPLFVSELTVLTTLKHPHLMQIFDVMRFEDTVFYTLEFFDGGDLVTICNASKRMPESGICRLYTQFASGIGYMHHNGFAHRDIKPANIMVDKTRTLCKVGDFGLVKQVFDTHTGKELRLESSAAGTICYLAPEALGVHCGRKHNKHFSIMKNDVWAVGLTLYQLFNGMCSAFSPDGRLMHEAFLCLQEIGKNNPVFYREEMSRDSKRFIERHLERDPNKRPTIDELLQDPWTKMQFRSPLRLPTETADQNNN